MILKRTLSKALKVLTDKEKKRGKCKTVQQCSQSGCSAAECVFVHEGGVNVLVEASSFQVNLQTCSKITAEKSMTQTFIGIVK